MLQAARARKEKARLEKAALEEAARQEVRMGPTPSCMPQVVQPQRH
jgi:hypothetical protein